MKNFDPTQHSLAIGGSLIPFDEATIEYDEDQNTMQVGTQGEQTRSKNLNKNATWTILLPQKNNANQILSALAIADTVFSLGFRDLEDGFVVAICPEGVIKKRPPLGYAKESAQLEWTFHGRTEITY